MYPHGSLSGPQIARRRKAAQSLVSTARGTPPRSVRSVCLTERTQFSPTLPRRKAQIGIRCGGESGVISGSVQVRDIPPIRTSPHSSSSLALIQCASQSPQWQPHGRATGTRLGCHFAADPKELTDVDIASRWHGPGLQEIPAKFFDICAGFGSHTKLLSASYLPLLCARRISSKMRGRRLIEPQVSHGSRSAREERGKDNQTGTT